ncbi:MAG: hypothetical protein WAT47_02340 [Nostocoides sp.]
MIDSKTTRASGGPQTSVDIRSGLWDEPRIYNRDHHIIGSLSGVLAVLPRLRSSFCIPRVRDYQFNFLVWHVHADGEVGDRVADGTAELGGNLCKLLF